MTGVAVSTWDDNTIDDRWKDEPTVLDELYEIETQQAGPDALDADDG